MENAFYTVRGYQLLKQHQGLLTPSLEDYLEMICREMEESGHARVSVLAASLHVQPSSVSKMIAKLAAMGLLRYERYGIIQLTEKGRQIGIYLLWRHDTLRGFFGLILPEDAQTAFAETELVEHIVGRETVEHIEKLLSFFESREELKEQLKWHLNSNPP